MKKRGSRRLLPLWGYVLLNGVMAAVLVAVHLRSEHIAAEGKWATSGTVPVLLVCFLAFLFVSVFDYFFDRATPPSTEAKPALPPERTERPASSGLSRETLKKPD